jgi:hypothetical protein
MDLPVFVLAVCVMALTAACSGSSTGAAKRSLSSPVLACAGVSARVPAGWHGRTRIGNGGFFTLTLASFPLVAESDDVDEQSAKRMSRGDVLVLLLGYGREQAGDSPFQTNVRLPLTVQRMRVYGQFEHLPRGHRLARVLFVADGAAYDAQVQFATRLTPLLRRKANSALQVLRFSKPSQTPRQRTRC